jgi:hypothetical protein
MSHRRRVQLFAAITTVALLVVVVVVASAALGPGSDPGPAGVALDVRRGDLLAVDRDRGAGHAYGRVFVTRAGRPRAARVLTGLSCERIAFAGGSGICLTLRRKFPVRTYAARLFDARGHVRADVGIQGYPSRARVSPGGRFAASTSFVSGDSYATPGAFSTRTVIYDAVRGRALADLERFTISLGGRAIHRPDFNFWGVTFEGDDGRFYATLATGSHHYLVHGDVRTRTATVLRDGVECPSLSPDGRRLVFKARVGDPFRWRFHVLDLRTGRVTALPETHSVDDQAEWLDDRTVAYNVDETVVAVRADGSARPHLLYGAANSPAVVR